MHDFYVFLYNGRIIKLIESISNLKHANAEKLCQKYTLLRRSLTLAQITQGAKVQRFKKIK